MINSYIRNTGFIIAEGADRLDFFNRMSSNDLTNFKVNTYRKTIFTNDKGRIVDFVTLINLDEKTIILSSPQHTDLLISHLEKYIIMDDVRLNKSKDTHLMLSLFGNGNLLEEVHKAGIDLKNDDSVITKDNLIAFYSEYKTGTVKIISSMERLEEIKGKLDELSEFNDAEFTIFRINNGIADSESELNEQINPIECGLNDYISYTKGCYIGQEVISRLDSQGKIPKQMVKIISDNGIKENDKIYSNDLKEVGFISSTAKNNSDSIGLGFIRSVSLDYDGEYYVKHGNDETKIKISKII